MKKKKKSQLKFDRNIKTQELDNETQHQQSLQSHKKKNSQHQQPHFWHNQKKTDSLLKKKQNPNKINVHLPISANIDNTPVVLEIEEDLHTPYTQKKLLQVQKIIESGKIKLIFDMSKVNLITSAGFAFLLASLRLTHSVNGELKLCCMSKQIKDLLTAVHLDLTFEIFNSKEEALQSFLDKTEIQFRKDKRMRIKELLKKSALEDFTEPLY